MGDQRLFRTPAGAPVSFETARPSAGTLGVAAGVRSRPMALAGAPNSAAARAVVGRRAPAASLQRFESLEHKEMGDAGADGERIALTPELSVTFGDLTALAGDYFGSADELRRLAETPGSAGPPFTMPGTVDEVRYALFVEVQGTMDKASFSDEVVNAAKARYYGLAAHNESHFSRPGLDDGLAVHQDLAAQGSANNAGSYRGNHQRAIAAAVEAGTGQCAPLDTAMLQEGFASHFLTDAFSAGHTRTPRHALGDWWNPKVPMFWHNLKLWLAENIAWHLNEHTKTGYLLTVNYFFNAAIETLENVMKKKQMPDLQFGDALSGALHDWDNEHGVMADVGTGTPVLLFGDGEVLDGDGRRTLQGAETFELAAAAVRVSIKDVRDAYDLAMSGYSLDEVEALLQTPDGLYRAEQAFPVALPDAEQGDNPSQDWMVESVDELFANPRMRQALTLFAHGKAATLGSEVELDPPLKDAKEAALQWTLDKLRASEPAVMAAFQEIVDYTPGLVTATIAGDAEGEGDLTGLLANTSDDQARSYYAQAKRTPGGLASLRPTQRVRLIRLALDGATLDDDEDMINGLLETSGDQLVQVINAVGWRAIWDDTDGAECAALIRIAGDRYWREQSYTAKRDEVAYLADGATGERAEELIVVILRTCTGAEVRQIDDEVGGRLGLSWDLDGVEQEEFDRLRARP